MTYPLLILLLALALSLAMAAAWAVALASGRSGWIDSIWSFALGAAGLAAALAPVAGAGPMTERQLLVAALVALWSLRLGLHIARRTHGGGDDPRYAHLRATWGAQARSQLFLFLQVQAASAVLLALSILAAARNPAPGLGPFDAAGTLILLAAILGEGLADRQLARFRADPARRGQVCDTGLWAWSRHPNYVFQWLGWLGYAAIALQGLAHYPYGLVALSGPAFMYVLLVHVSGIPPLEAHMLRARGDAFRAYQARVNAFFPGPPRQPGSSR
ncbi:DUF1295 domain-containing protein [Azorhizobium doebereinerae]|uniref:DUF1295 domain-containing protein n=1 Tax=Azorhizobium doebereinerae TaxID=281091 RepID=UPI0004211DB9|nr:DUF1295 domain-containing protein [Azorhizobium doebereinerae]